MSEPKLDAGVLAATAQALARAVGLSLGDGLERSLDRALVAAGLELDLAPAALAAAVQAGEPRATEVLAEHAVVGETCFWRHPEGLVVLAAALASREAPLRIWSAGCATGEEPYSLAMALLDAGRDRGDDRVLGTDVAARALVLAEAGRYQPRSLRRLPHGLQQRWLRETPRGAEVAPRLAEMVRFERHNLLDAPPPGPFDAVVCRNVLIYFDAATPASALDRLIEPLRLGGFLLLGPVELSLATDLSFDWVARGGATLLRKPG
jgi:chemotaxis protein methyltransferase CheR